MVTVPQYWNGARRTSAPALTAWTDSTALRAADSPGHFHRNRRKRALDVESTSDKLPDVVTDGAAFGDRHHHDQKSTLADASR